MPFLLGGFFVLCGLLLLVYLFVNADPTRLARNLKIAAIVLGVATVVGLVFLPPLRELAALLIPLAMSMPFLARLRSVIDRFRNRVGGQSSTVASAYLRMTLDHDTGAMTGTVLQGRFAGMRLDELGAAELLDLLRECRADDEDGARLLEAYLDRIRPDWRDELHDERAGGPARPAGGDMTVEEAYAVLGLAPGADAEAVKAAHHRLMVKLHPDHGGSDFLASQINRARDVLLRRTAV
jgi:hypothetical protein